MLESLHKRPRGRAVARVLTALELTAAPPAPPVPAPPYLWDPLDRELIRRPRSAGPVSRRLHARLAQEDLARMRERLATEEAAVLAAASEPERPGLELSFSLAHVAEAEARTGLRALEPPADVHALRRGTRYLGGAFPEADRFAEPLEAAGAPLDELRRGLDFGCSSGRLARALAAAYPNAEWHGCDPQETAIAWAARHFPEIAWRRSDVDPPLPYPDGHFDTVIGFSIWTQFGERAARRWFAEMHRVIEPGGHLALSTIGLGGLYYLAAGRLWDAVDIGRAMRALYRHGYFFQDVFGDAGDWGIRDPDEWGWSHISPEWMAAELCPAWAIVTFWPGYIDEFQDVWVLQRR